MRDVINISLPKEMTKIVKEEVKRGRYASVSEFFRFLLRSYEENRMLRDLERSDREIASGKGKLLRSLKDLR